MEDTLCDIASEQIAVGKDFYPWDALVLAVFDPISQLFVDERFAITVQVDQSRTPLDALFDHRFKDVLFHVRLRSTNGRSRAKHAVGLAMVGRFDAYGFGKRLTQKGHRVSDDVGGDRTDGSDKRLSKSGHVESFDTKAGRMD